MRWNSWLVPLAGIEPACLAATDFESVASTNFATGAAAGWLDEAFVRRKPSWPRRYRFSVSRWLATIAQRLGDVDAADMLAPC